MAHNSQFWEYNGGYNNAGGAPYNLLINRDQIVMRIAGRLRAKGNRKVAALMDSLLGAAVGQQATSSYKRVTETPQFSNVGLGGARPLETRTIINRPSTAADLTLLDRMHNETFKPAAYPVDKSGNGGGGKLGGFGG